MNFAKYLFIIGILFFVGCSSDSGDAVQEEVPPVVDPEDSQPPASDPEISEADLLDLTQRETFKYFWDFAEKNSGAARERYIPANASQDQNIVTTGGTGFGLMSIIVGIERQFISRPEGVARFTQILGFLKNADRFHGAWPHWINGSTGNVIPFSAEDDGADLVETAFLAQGLITVGEYLKDGSAGEKQLSKQAFDLVNSIEWNFFTQNENVLYWHWSPNTGFSINLQLRGYNETLLPYILAAASTDFGIEKAVYDAGWARNGGIQSANTAYNYPLLVKHDGAEEMGGPLFWAHYSYLGLDPRNLADAYSNYWDVNVNHSLINYSYCVENPLGYRDYGEKLWGLTASYSRNADGSLGYNAHRPGNDAGVISPTAAISSIPYTSEKSLAALYNFNENREKLLGPAGFYDAFSPQYDWVAEAYLAIDQGPQIIMIENYRTGLLWNLFMQNEQIQAGLDKLEFRY
ncbi:glucoamylase family protein [Flavimarina sp. Hel_I_48]|uniref:glucoamylase family protein n=1 Tax=Flavimarina sp. Hel_I_48 TaxID=1392488 RepID=UPI0004DF1EFC|nr:glucoamylase family protein [Flavimarina sp. Hel_I_48]